MNPPVRTPHPCLTTSRTAAVAEEVYIGSKQCMCISKLHLCYVCAYLCCGLFQDRTVFFYPYVCLLYNVDASYFYAVFFNEMSDCRDRFLKFFTFHTSLLAERPRPISFQRCCQGYFTLTHLLLFSHPWYCRVL